MLDTGLARTAVFGDIYTFNIALRPQLGRTNIVAQMFTLALCLLCTQLQEM